MVWGLGFIGFRAEGTKPSLNSSRLPALIFTPPSTHRVHVPHKESLGFRVSGLGFRVQGLGFRL